MTGTSMPIRVSPVVGRNFPGVVMPMLVCFSLGFFVGITFNSKFPNFYLPFLPPLPSARVSSPSPSPLLPPPVPSPPPPPALQPPPPPPSPPPPTPSMASAQSPKEELMTGSLSSVKRNNMTDEELLWLASMSANVQATAYHRVPKVAFLFLARGDLPLRPLWEKFFAGHDGLYSIYVHADPSYTGSPPADSVFYDRMIRSQNTSWGDVTLVDAARRLVANALLDLGNQRFALLSESCIPLYNFTTVYAVITGSNTSFQDSFVNHDSEVRYNPFFGRRPGPGGGNITLAQWRKGAQWFVMDRALAVALVSDDVYFPAFREYCARHRYCFAEEHYVPTLLSVLGWTRNANRTLTYADWRRGGSHPRTHGARDATEALIREIRGRGAGGFGGADGFGGAGKNCTAYSDGASGFCYLFARKFAPDTLEPLLRLAPKIMGFG